MQRRTDIAILTNARSSGQNSMIGYGGLLLEAARHTGLRVSEWRGVSLFDGRIAGKLGRNLDRFALTPAWMTARRAGLVHVVDPGNALYLDLLRHDRSVVTVHDCIPYLAAAGRLPGYRPSRAARLLMRAIVSRLRRVDRIVCVSENTRRDLLAVVEPDPERVITIRNAVFRPYVPAAPAAQARLRQGLGLDERARIVLHVGRNFYKNHAAVLEVFGRLARERSDLVLVLVTPLTSALIEGIARRGIEARTRVQPYVQPDDMAALYTTASLLLYPSTYEGFGYPVLEAQLCGTPVVCSDAGALPEVAGAGARLFAPDDVAGMAAAAGELLDDEHAAAAAIARGLENATRFDRGTWIAAHHALYRSLGLACVASNAALEAHAC